MQTREQFITSMMAKFGLSHEAAEEAYLAQDIQEDPMTEITETISTESNGHTEKRRPRAPKPIIEQGESANLAMQMREIKKQAAARRMVLLRELKELEDEFGKTLIDESPAPKPRASKPPIAKAKPTAAAPDEVVQLAAGIVALIDGSDKEYRSEAIRSALSCDKTLLAKALKYAVGEGMLLTKGQKRATVYLVP